MVQIHSLQNQNKIPVLTGEIYNFIKKGYTGGIVDVYKPSNNDNSPIYHYDVTSLYPYAMKNSEYPVGQPILFEGNIDKYYDLSQYSGFVEVEVEYNISDKCSINHIPLLPVKHNKSCISPIGNWRGYTVFLKS